MPGNGHKLLRGIVTERQFLNHLQPVAVIHCTLGFDQELAGFDDAADRFPPSGRDPVGIEAPVAIDRLDNLDRLDFNSALDNDRRQHLAALTPLTGFVALRVARNALAAIFVTYNTAALLTGLTLNCVCRGFHFTMPAPLG